MTSSAKSAPTIDDLENECRWVLHDYWTALVKSNRDNPSEETVSRLVKAGLAYSQFEPNMNPDAVE